MVKKDFHKLTLRVVLVPVLACLLLCSKEALAALPYVELISFLILLYTRHFGWYTLPAIYIFVLLEGLLYGFGLWFLMYLYIWLILYLVIRLIGPLTSALAWAIILGIFGLLFGTLCSLPYFFTMGPGGAITWIVTGIPVDIGHGIGNFFITLLLWKSMNKAFSKITTIFKI